MARRFSPFSTFARHRELGRIRREVDRFESSLQQFIDDVLPQQQARLRAIRESGPWEADHDLLVRLQNEQARVVIQRMRQQRELREEVEELERMLPPRRGWNRLRYVDPWLVMIVLFGVAMTVNGVRLGMALAG